MERHGEEVHIETDEARGGSTPHIVRYVLIISMVLAIGLLSLVWITGATGGDQHLSDSAVRNDAAKSDAVRQPAPQ